MSVSKWRWTEACDKVACCGDCDECGYEPEEVAEEDKFEIMCNDLTLVFRDDLRFMCEMFEDVDFWGKYR